MASHADDAAARRPRSLGSPKVEPLTCWIGAELKGVNLGDAVARRGIVRGDQGLAAQAQGPLPPRPGHHPRPSTSPSPGGSASWRIIPVLGSDPENPGLVRIYKDLTSPPEHYENAWHCDATWREAPPMGSVLRCVACPEVGGDTIWANMAKAYEDLSPAMKAQIEACVRATRSRPASAPRCRSSGVMRSRRSSPTPSTPWCAPTRRRARRCCSSTASPPTSSTSTPRRTSATARISRPAGPIC